MTTITKERLLKIQHWRETYGADSNVMLPAEEAEELARIALAALEAEKGADPIVFTDERNLRHIARGRETSLIWGKQNQEVGDIPLYRHAQPVPVDKEFIPKNLDKALGVVGVALPESKEEFNFQIERWIQLLIDRVIRYADEFKEQPVPVVPDEKPMPEASKMHAIDAVAAIAEVRGWNACRAAMLQAGNSPVTPDTWIPVSERMPERDVDVQVYCADTKEQMVGYMERNEAEGWFRFASLPNGGGVYCKPTHWMPLPAEPQQEVKP
ncbi:DUF551 domain-containing protein [Salmonella enterica subsp. enterica serovar Newport]|nr:DUF551 domain-containing protein [Salmonella enterica subsp. enterica serovar Newport]